LSYGVPYLSKKVGLVQFRFGLFPSVIEYY